MWNNNSYNNSFSSYMAPAPRYQAPVSYARPQYNQQPAVLNNNFFGGLHPQMLIQLLMGMLSGQNNYQSNYQAPNNYAPRPYPQPPVYNQPYPQPPIYNCPPAKDGYNGKDGLNGYDGMDGRDGYDGKDGLNGYDGKDGKDGYNGKDGINGKDGLNGYNGKDGINGKDGKNGYDGKNGKDGYNGKDGVNGYNGKDGINGKDGKDGIGKDGKDGINGKDGKDGVCCDKDEQICVGIYGDPTVKINPINGQHFASTLTSGFDSKMEAGKTYTLLSDTATNGKKFEIKNVMGDINGAANAGGVATSASIIKNGDYTIEISSGDKPKAVVKDSTNTIIKTIELSEAVSNFELPDGSGTLKLVNDLQDGVDPAVKTKGFKFESKMVGTEYEAAYIPRTIDLKDGKNGKGYLLESTFCELKADSAKGAKGYKFELPVGGVNVKLSVADMMNSTQTSGVAGFVQFLESQDNASFVA